MNNEDIITEDFPELQRCGEYSNPQAARVHFAQVMRVHGYESGSNRTWLKTGYAAVMEPR